MQVLLKELKRVKIHQVEFSKKLQMLLKLFRGQEHDKACQI